MQRDGIDNPDDPEAELRRRVMSQVSGDQPPVDQQNEPAPSDPSGQVYDPGSPVWSEQHPFGGVGTPGYNYSDPPARDNTQPPAAPSAPQQGIPDPPAQAPSPSPSDGSSFAYPSQGGSASIQAIVANLYRTALGREASLEEIQNQIMGGSGDLATIQQSIYASPEAQAYGQRRSAASTPTPSPPVGGGRPTGGSLTDPAYAAKYVAWAATQPGVNPSVKNDPGYWIGRFTSGAFKNDQEYALQRMMQAEGAPEGAAPAAPRAVAPPTSYQMPAAPAWSVGGQAAPQGVWNSDFTNQLRAMLMQRLSAASQPVDPNDPTINATMTAARDQSTRASDTERTQLAEHLYAQGGLNTDAISQKVQQSGEKNALGLSSLRATLITRELQSKRDELKSLMQMAMQSGDAESARAIQMQMAELDATVRREGLGVDLAKYQAYLNTVGSQAVM